jgi:hypothetical protein
MHDRAADAIGAATSATTVASEIMILLNIEPPITQVRLRVEEKRSHEVGTRRAVPTVGAAGFRLLFGEDFARKRAII